MVPNSLGDGLATSPNWKRGHELQSSTWLLDTLAAWRRCHYNVHDQTAPRSLSRQSAAILDARSKYSTVDVVNNEFRY